MSDRDKEVSSGNLVLEYTVWVKPSQETEKFTGGRGKPLNMNNNSK